MITLEGMSHAIQRVGRTENLRYLPAAFSRAFSVPGMSIGAVRCMHMDCALDTERFRELAEAVVRGRSRSPPRGPNLITAQLQDGRASTTAASVHKTAGVMGPQPLRL